MPDTDWIIKMRQSQKAISKAFKHLKLMMQYRISYSQAVRILEILNEKEQSEND